MTVNEIIEQLQREKTGAVMAIRYDDNGTRRTTVGFYYGIAKGKIDLRSHRGEIEDLVTVRDAHIFREVPITMVLEYKILDGA